MLPRIKSVFIYIYMHTYIHMYLSLFITSYFSQNMSQIARALQCVLFVWWSVKYTLKFFRLWVYEKTLPFQISCKKQLKWDFIKFSMLHNYTIRISKYQTENILLYLRSLCIYKIKFWQVTEMVFRQYRLFLFYL